MTDIFSARKRSAIMKSIKGKDTKPEIAVRSIVHRMGYRFRVNQGMLPGNPDIVLKKHKKVIFVNGCFWHGHLKCRRSRLPTSNENYWKNKIIKNMARDKKQIKLLHNQGWNTLVVWTCEIQDKKKISEKIANYLSSSELKNDIRRKIRKT